MLRFCRMWLHLLVVYFAFSGAFSLSAGVLEKARPEGICGTPLFWNRKNDVRIIKRLYKYVEADTTFFIREDVFEVPAELIEVPFYKVFSSDTVDIYVEKDQWDRNNVTQEDIDSFIEYILYRTPYGSINQHKGIIPNEYTIFGTPSDIDRNGKILILMIDVRDNYVEGVSETFVAGYFDPLDMSPDRGNYGEIIYVDTYPSHPESFYTLSIIAHELQHLIHYNYDPDEENWLNEGLSELAPRLLGLPSRSFSIFLNSPNRALIKFNNSILDYSKVGLFMFYVYQHFGIDIIKDIVRSTDNSVSSIESVLRSKGYTLSKEELLLRWFIANLINDPVAYGGIYSYQGALIPALYTKHFHCSFSEEVTEGKVEKAAAEYIQFYSGSEIKFDFEYDQKELIDLVVVKDIDGVPDISFVRPCPGQYHFEDKAFGKEYTKITFIPFRTTVTSPYESISFSYVSSGIEDREEFEVSYDMDSLDFYIQLKTDDNPIEGCEKFYIEGNDWKLRAVKVKMYDESPLRLTVYNGTGTEMLYQKDGIVPGGNSWTRIDVGRLEFPEDMDSILVGIYSPDNALGYTSVTSGKGKAFIKYQESLIELSTLTVTIGQEQVELTGNWLIRAIFERKLVIPAGISVSPDTLYFHEEQTRDIVKIENPGTEPLTWKIDNDLPWLYFDPDSGLTLGTSEVIVSVDMDLVRPGIHNVPAIVNSNAGKDSFIVNVFKKNLSYPQAAIIPFNEKFSDTCKAIDIQIINIGTGGTAEFSLRSVDNSVSAYPSSGSVGIMDTLQVKLFFNKYLARSNIARMLFFNGVDTEEVVLKYEGEILPDEKEFRLYPPFSNPLFLSKQQMLYIPVKISSEITAEVRVYNLLGQIVREYRIDRETGESVLVAWNGRDRYGKLVPSGVYFVVLRQKGNTAVAKILVIK